MTHPDLIPMGEGMGYRHRLDKREPGKSGPRVSVTDREGQLLAVFASERDVLEIGTGTGVSARFMRRTAESVATVDIDPWVREHVWPGLPASCFESRDAVCGRRFTMVFIDGDHALDAVSEDIAFARNVCPSGLIVLHDFKDHRVKLAAKRSGLDFYAIDTEYGLGLAVVP